MRDHEPPQLAAEAEGEGGKPKAKAGLKCSTSGR
jgi:hypothetical protein